MRHAADFEEWTPYVEQAEDSEGGSGVAAATDAAVIAQFRERFAGDKLGHQNRRS